MATERIPAQQETGAYGLDEYLEDMLDYPEDWAD